jgi:hypothetical protein
LLNICLYGSRIEEQKQKAPQLCILPLNRASAEVKDSIWSEILAFALDVNLRLVAPACFKRISRWRKTLLCVSKVFHVSYDGLFLSQQSINVLLKRLGEPHFYSHPILLSRTALLQFSHRLVDDASLGLHLRHLYLWRDLHEDFYAEDDELDIRHQIDDKAIMDIILRAPRLIRVYGPNLRTCSRIFFDDTYTLCWEAFCVMAHTSGHSLLEFVNVAVGNKRELCTSRPFHSFTALRSFFWNCHIKFNVDGDSGGRECFPCLKSLSISICDSSFLELLSRMK